MPGENANARPSAPRPYGVLGRTLGHSYTPAIYRELAGLDYVRFEREPACVEAFLRGDEWEGVNVTIPYKKAAAKIVDELSPIARRLGNVNTVTRLADGRLRGDNTDYYGFKMLVEALGLDLAGKRALVFGGHGGAGSTCMVVLGDLKMEPVAVCRTPESAEDAGAASAYSSATYDELDAYRDAALVVNATPVGMYPDCPASVWPLDAFPALEAVVDIVYNPARTGLMMEAERRGIPAIGGLLMLVAQAAAAVERYTGEVVSLERIRAVTAALDAAEENIALIGMPGAGKTRVGAELARLLGRPHVDIDAELERALGTSCADYITAHGEDAFRIEETAVLGRVGARSALVISCGGGVVVRPENYGLLHQNARIVMLDRPLDELSSKGRPVSQRDGIAALAERRLPLYRAWADAVVASRATPAATAQSVRDALSDI
ncbi:shikimate kinase [Collinsella intestinalis]|uniref:shikimate kinase n=1 Tax=Collinsella intestinalis TaxID=147207 RepID=UPI00195EA2A3|nr:shikimate kinase [Collinsella intestinalis]MBM6906962.1 hypothetical protein [Collinsella intestinalis]MBM6941701.1 hypothetical protein [Collinsella intestinalis]